MTDPTDGNPPSDTERHNAKMARKKQARDKIMATKTDEKGLVIVHTGKGKGKSTAAFGSWRRASAASAAIVARIPFLRGNVADQINFAGIVMCALVGGILFSAIRLYV